MTLPRCGGLISAAQGSATPANRAIVRKQKGNETMRTETIEIFQYDELSDAAKSKARDWYREASTGDLHYAESVTEDFQAIAALVGIEIGKRGDGPAIGWSGFCCQGDGASFEGTFTGKPCGAERVKAYAPVDEALHAIAARIDAAISSTAPFELSATITQSGRYVHARTMDAQFDAIGPDGIPAEIAEGIKSELLECFRALADWLYRQLEAAHDWETGDENVAETIKANEYEFTAEGKRHV